MHWPLPHALHELRRLDWMPHTLCTAQAPTWGTAWSPFPRPSPPPCHVQHQGQPTCHQQHAPCASPTCTASPRTGAFCLRHTGLDKPHLLHTVHRLNPGSCGQHRGSVQGAACSLHPTDLLHLELVQFGPQVDPVTLIQPAGLDVWHSCFKILHICYKYYIVCGHTHFYNELW